MKSCKKNGCTKIDNFLFFDNLQKYYVTLKTTLTLWSGMTAAGEGKQPKL